MSSKRYKPEQIVTLLSKIEVDIANVKNTPQACKEAEFTMQTYCRWRKTRAKFHSAVLEEPLADRPDVGAAR